MNTPGVTRGAAAASGTVLVVNGSPPSVLRTTGRVRLRGAVAPCQPSVATGRSRCRAVSNTRGANRAPFLSAVRLSTKSNMSGLWS